MSLYLVYMYFLANSINFTNIHTHKNYIWSQNFRTVGEEKVAKLMSKKTTIALSIL